MDKAEVVIIGGGITGASIAWHLSAIGIDDVVVVERNMLASAASSQAAGLIMPVTSKPGLTPLVQRTLADFAELEQATGDPVPFHAVGSLRVSHSKTTLDDINALSGMAAAASVDCVFMDAAGVGERVPWINRQLVEGALYFPDDGYIDPYALTACYAAAARKNGVRIMQKTVVTDIDHEQGGVSAVQTSQGSIACRWVVDAAGAWANLLAARVDVALPMVPVRSQYWVSSQHPQLKADQPIVMLPDAAAYARPEVGGLLLGIQERQSRTFDARDLPADINDFLITGDEEQWDALIESHDLLQRYIRGFDDIEWPHYVAGLSSYTPDGKPLIGAVEGIQGFLVAAGCSGYGIALSGGVGRAIADLIITGGEQSSLKEFRPGRFGRVAPYSAEFRQRCARARSNKAKLRS